MSITTSLATVTVTFHPDLSMLEIQLSRLPTDALRIVVDNASPEPLRARLRTLVAEYGVTLIENAANLGARRCDQYRRRTCTARRCSARAVPRSRYRALR